MLLQSAAERPFAHKLDDRSLLRYCYIEYTRVAVIALCAHGGAPTLTFLCACLACAQ